MNEQSNNFATSLYLSLYETYQAPLVRYAATYVGRTEDAEDLVQDLFTRLWERRDSLSAIDNKNAYLYALTRNRCMDHLRHRCCESDYQVREQLRFEQEMQQRLHSSDPSEVTVESLQALRHSLFGAVRALPGRCKTIFLLCKLRDMKHRDIALRLGISVNTVEGQMSIALRKLRASLHHCQPTQRKVS